MSDKEDSMFGRGSFVLSALIVLGTFAVSAVAQDTFASTQNCSKETLMSFFPPSIVKSTLESHDVPKDQWEAILKDLAVKDKQLIQEVEAKAAKLTPNPLKEMTSPGQRSAAVKLFRETMLESFTLVMNAHGIDDPEEIAEMLDDVQDERAKVFDRCGRQGGIPKETAGGNSGSKKS